MRGFALAAALLAAAVLPGERLGLAVPVVAALMLLAAAAGIRLTPLRLTLGLLACALAAQAALLDATWVVWLNLGAAWVVASFAAAGPGLWALAAPAWALQLVPELTPRPTARWAPVFRGGALGTLLLPFGALFLWADAAFAAFAGELPLPSGASLPGRLATLALVLAGALGLGLAPRLRRERQDRRAMRSLSLPEWAIPLALLDALFLAFVAVQLAVLFGGHERVLETAGLTYAEYARSGFWQLLVVACLTFLVVGAIWKLADVRTRRDGLVLRILLGTLLGLTLVVLVSVLHRMRLYEETFGLTRMRLLVEVFALWLGTMLVLVGAAGGVAGVRARLAPAAVLLTAGGVLAFSLGSPDRYIAQRNIDRWEATGSIDEDYLGSLSADAVPALVELPAARRMRVTAALRERLRVEDSWSSANLSRARARELLGLSGR